MQKTVAIIAGIMLLLAIFSWPYGYYQLTRIVIFFAGAYLAYSLYKLHKEGWIWILAITVIIFNPFFPLRLTKGTWVILDLIAAIIFFVSVSAVKKVQPSDNEQLKSS